MYILYLRVYVYILHLFTLDTRQKHFLGAWRNYRSGAGEANGDDNDKGKKEGTSEDKEKVQ